MALLSFCCAVQLLAAPAVWIGEQHPASHPFLPAAVLCVREYNAPRVCVRSLTKSMAVRVCGCVLSCYMAAAMAVVSSRCLLLAMS